MRRTRDGAPDLLRLQYAEGARLRGRDLREIRDGGPARLGLHVLASHETWGVASGMLVDATSGSAVTVGPGAAFNCRGRALLLQNTVQLPAVGPELAGRVLEVVVGPAPDQPECGRFHAPEGCPPYEGRLPIEGVVRWAPVGSSVERPGRVPWCARNSEEVLLGRYSVNKVGNLEVANPPGRSVAATRAWAKSGHGVEDLASLDWKRETEGWAAEVDTSSAGFTQVPAYVLSIEDFPLDSPVPPPIVQMLTVTGPPDSSFRIGLLWGTRGGDPDLSWVSPKLLSNIRLRWTGVEPVQGCSLQFSPLIAFPLSVTTIMGGFIRG